MTENIITEPQSCLSNTFYKTGRIYKTKLSLVHPNTHHEFGLYCVIHLRYTRVCMHFDKDIKKIFDRIGMLFKTLKKKQKNLNVDRSIATFILFLADNKNIVRETKVYAKKGVCEAILGSLDNQDLEAKIYPLFTQGEQQ